MAMLVWFVVTFISTVLGVKDFIFESWDRLCAWILASKVNTCAFLFILLCIVQSVVALA